MKHLILIIALLLTLVSCNNDDNSIVAHELIKAGQISLTSPVPQSTSVKSQAEWDQLSNLFYENYSENVDFNTHQLIIAFDEPRPDGGYSILIKSVTENNKNIIAKLKLHQSELATMMPIQPFCIVKIPKSNKPTIFMN